MADANTFNGQIGQWAKVTVPAEVSKATRTIALEALTRIVRRTPVDLGQLRGGWVVALGAPSTSQGRPSKSAEGPITRGAERIARHTGFVAIHITNNVRHVLVVEQGGFTPPNPGPSRDPRRGRKGRILVRGGYSVQAPKGMALVTVEELRRQFARVRT